jgi:glycosyltransferase involved in cell wall biosynthesis
MTIIVGPLPPPTHGAAVITARVVETLREVGIVPEVCNTAPRQSRRTLAYHWSRLRAYGRAWSVILTRGRAQVGGRHIYISLSGGLGLAYDLIAVLCGRLRGGVPVFHHHSFAYLDKPSPLIRAIIAVAGERQIHIVLCARMAACLRGIYGAKLRTEIVSNLAFLPQAPDRRSTPRFATIGYLSNLVPEKGVDRFLDLIAGLRARGSTIKACIAGPFHDDAYRRHIERRIQDIGNVDYWGAIGELEKAQFFAGIDLLIFPSRYVNEAEPLVLYEAMLAGVPTIASARGCIAEVIGGKGHFLLSPDASDIENLIAPLMAWQNDPSRFAAETERQMADFVARLAERPIVLHRFTGLFRVAT